MKTINHILGRFYCIGILRWRHLFVVPNQNHLILLSCSALRKYFAEPHLGAKSKTETMVFDLIRIFKLQIHFLTKDIPLRMQLARQMKANDSL
jgi:hypothetical protein